MTIGVETANHHGSHRDLLWQGDGSAPTLKVAVPHKTAVVFWGGLVTVTYTLL